jgi:hypothetical protein
MNILKTAKQKAIDEAKRTAKDVSEELKEIPKSVPSQATGGEVRSTGLFSKKVEPIVNKPEVVDARSDINKFPGTVSEQLFGKKPEPTEKKYDATGGGLPTIVEAMLQKSPGQIDKTDVKIPDRSLETQIEEEKKEREERERQWEEQQDQLMSAGKANDDEGVVSLPSSGRRRGPAIPGSKTPKSPETRTSKH